MLHNFGTFKLIPQESESELSSTETGVLPMQENMRSKSHGTLTNATVDFQHVQYHIRRNFHGKNISCVKFLLHLIFMGQATHENLAP